MVSVDEIKCLVPTSVVLDPLSNDGELRGLECVIKDLMAIENHTSSFGIARWRETHEHAAKSSPVVERIRYAGARVLGLSKMDQMAYSLIGNVGEGEAPVNVFDRSLYCGGSSSGSAAAVAAGVADFAIGTDTAGSIRVPAAACGIYGFRPSHNIVDTTGVIPLAESFDVVGVLANSVDLLTTVLNVLSPESRVHNRHVRRLGLPLDVIDGMDQSIGKAIVKAVQRLADRVNLEVMNVEAKQLVSNDVGDLFARLQGREIWANHSEWVEANVDVLADDVRTRLERCREWASGSAEEKAADREGLSAYRERFADLVGEDGILVLPVVPYRGPQVQWTDEELLSFRLASFRLTAPSSFVGGPQLVLPTSTDAGTWEPPISLVGLPGDDLTVLRIGSDYEA